MLPYLVAIFTSTQTNSKNKFAGVAVMIDKGKMIIHEKILKVAKDDRQTDSKAIKIAYPPKASYDSTIDKSSFAISFKEDQCERYFCILSTEAAASPGYPYPSPAQLPTLAKTSDGDLNNDCFLYAWSSPDVSNKRSFSRLPVELKGSCTYGECSFGVKERIDGTICNNDDMGGPILCQGKLSYIVHRPTNGCALTFPAYKVASILTNKSRRDANSRKNSNANNGNMPRYVATRGRPSSMATGRRPAAAAAAPVKLAPRKRQPARSRARTG